MKNIFEVLRQKEIEFRRLQQEVEALRTAAHLLADEKEQQQIPAGKLSQTDMIKAVLKDRGQPMHVKDISEAIEKRFKKQIAPAYVAPVIHRNLGKVFAKADRPNTFGLLEWPLNQVLENGSKAA
jgi:hypothetical protein